MATETYKFGGPGRLITDGSIVNPKETVEIGETVELDEERVKQLRKRGLKLTKDSDSEPDVQAAGTPSASSPAASSGQPGTTTGGASGQGKSK